MRDMKNKQNSYIARAVKKMIKVRDLKPSKDAKGGLTRVLPSRDGLNQN